MLHCDGNQIGRVQFGHLHVDLRIILKGTFGFGRQKRTELTD
jgi:hypothetical protein